MLEPPVLPQIRPAIDIDSIQDARIFILDDEPLNVKLLRDYLENLGFSNVESENDPRDALEQIRAFRPDILLLDINMPYKSGYEVLEEIQQGSTEEHDFPVLVLTADPSTQTRLKALELGASDFLTKPIDLIELDLRAKHLIAARRLRLQLKRHAEHLEEIVSERTAQLSATNARLVQFDKLKSEFVATASHELRTPLSVIREFTSLLRDGAVGPDPDDIRDAFDTVMRNCDRLGRLLNDLLDFHRIETGNLRLNRTRTSIGELIEQCAHDFTPKCRAANIFLMAQLPKEACLVLADTKAIGQVLSNLLGNASKFTPSGGSITIGANKTEGFIEVFVEDTGIGIAPEDVEKALLPFGQLHPTDEGPGIRGTGLGLPITQRIIAQHGGELIIKSTIGKGSRFSFTLPLWEQATGLASFVSDVVKASEERTELTLLIVRPLEEEPIQLGKALDTLHSLCQKMCRSTDAFTISEPHGCIVGLFAADVDATNLFYRRLLEAARSFSFREMRVEYSVAVVDRSKDDPIEAFQRAWEALPAT